MAKSIGRRAFLASAGALGAAATDARAESPAAKPATPPVATPPAPAGYVFLKPAEAAFVEAVANHMVPADELTPSGVDLGIPVYVDRALAGGWGKGDRFYKEGPWRQGTPNQGYQLALTPAELYRAGVAQANAYCRKTWGKSFDRLAAAQKEAFLQGLARGEVQLPGGLPARPFFDLVHQTVMEGMFADPIYGGNRDKAAWKMLGFPGVMANNAVNARTYNDGRRFPAKPLSIADMS